MKQAIALSIVLTAVILGCVMGGKYLLDYVYSHRAETVSAR